MAEDIIHHELVGVTRQLPVWFQIIDRCGYTATHWHEYTEAVYQLDGAMEATVQGRTYSIEKGDVLLVNGSQLHRTRAKTASAPYILLQIPSQFMERALLYDGQVVFANHIPGADKELSSAFEKMRTAYTSREQGWTILFMEGLYALLYVLFRKHRAQDRAGAAEKSGHIRQIAGIIEWIQENYSNQITLQQAADRMAVSKAHFCRLFRKYTGQTFLEYLNCLRASRLWEDLSAGTDSISQLMERHGIGNYKVFSRTFKALYGTTPRQVRSGMAERGSGG